MNLKKLFKDYFVSWFQEPEYDYTKLTTKKEQSPIELKGDFDYGRALGLYRYDSTVNKTILGEFMYRFKYKGDEKCGLAIAEYLYQFLKDEQLLDIADIITTVPVTNKGRKFIPMRYIVEQLKNELEAKYQPDLLIRKKVNGETKAVVGPNERKEKVKDTFEVNERFDLGGKKIILIDDIYDSGATINACAKALGRAGAFQIMAVTITSTGRKAR